MYDVKKVESELLAFAAQDANIVAAVLNGSRVDEGAPKDILNDFDIAFYVSDLAAARKYMQTSDFEAIFGKIAISQQNEFEAGFINMMQFKNALRLDLSFHHIDTLAARVAKDSLSVLFYCADGAVAPFAAPSDASYRTKLPTHKQWDETLNEIFWLQPYVAKALWRDEQLLACRYFYEYLMPQVVTVLMWRTVHEHGEVNTGALGKRLNTLAPPALYNELMALYAQKDMWRALFAVDELVNKTVAPLAANLGFEYPARDEFNANEYIHFIKDLPRE